MARYKLLQPHFLNGHYREAGEIVTCDPEKASKHMTRLDEPKADSGAEEVTEEEVAATVAAIKAEPKDGELTDNGNPKKAAIEERLGKTVPQPLYLKAFR